MLLYKTDLGKDVDVALISDSHLGNVACSEEKLEEAVGIAKSEKMPIIIQGDMIEAKHITHPHWSPDVHEGKYGLISDQCAEIADKFYSVRKQIVSWGYGNHENNKGIIPIMKPWQEIKKNLKIDVPSAFTIKIELCPGLRGLFSHGNIYVNSMAGDPDQIRLGNAIRMKRRLEKLPGVDDCKIVSTAHGHRLINRDPSERIYIGGIDELKQIDKAEFRCGDLIHTSDTFYCMTGSFLKSVAAQSWKPGVEDVATYTELASYGYTELGFQVMHIRNGKLESVEAIKL